jgi:hypothetical protein
MRSPLKMKNPACAALKRDAKEATEAATATAATLIVTPVASGRHSSLSTDRAIVLNRYLDTLFQCMEPK